MCMLKTLPMSTPLPNNVIVRVVLRPVNPTDLLISQERAWAHLNLKSVVMGSEGVGVIHEVGAGVTNVKVGQRVIPLIWSSYHSLGYGLWRDYVKVPEIDHVPVPDDVLNEVAAQFLINPWTAYGMLNKFQVPKASYLLETAAGSVLGRQVVSLAKHYGIKTINVVRRDEWIQPLKDLGADYVINSTKEDVQATVKEITRGKGAYGALDPVASDTTAIQNPWLNYRVLRSIAERMQHEDVVASCVRGGGHVIVYGMLSGNKVSLAIADLMRQVSISVFVISDYKNDLPKREATVKAVLELLSMKIITPLVGTTYLLEEFEEAIKETERDSRGRKAMLSSY